MLAHKVDGEHCTEYFNLLLAAWKLKRLVEASNPLLPKATPMGGLNVTHSQTSGNFFLSQKLKGSHIFTARSATVDSNRVTEDFGLKAEEAEEVKTSDGEDPETLDGVRGADQMVRYIICFANVVELYQKKNWNCFRCGSPDHLI